MDDEYLGLLPIFPFFLSHMDTFYLCPFFLIWPGTVVRSALIVYILIIMQVLFTCDLPYFFSMYHFISPQFIYEYFLNFLCIYPYMCVWAQLLSRAWLFVTPWTVAHQAPLSMGFSQQGYWSGLPFSHPGGLPNPGTKPTSPVSPALAGRFFTTEPPGKHTFITNLSENFTETMNLSFLYIQTHSYWIGQKVLWVRWWKTWTNFLTNWIISSWRCLLKPPAALIWSG